MNETCSSNSRSAVAGAFLLGTASMIAQLALMREFLGAFAGNELIIGFVLGYWFVLTAFGTEVGRRWRKGTTLGLLIGLEVAASVAPLLQVVAIRLLRSTLLPGVAPGPDLALWSTAVILFPGCIANGWLFAVLVRLIVEARRGESGQAYLVETIGLAAGGSAYSLFLCTRLGSIDLAALIAVQNGLAAVAFGWLGGRRRLAILAGLAVAVLVVGGYIVDLDGRTLRAVYPAGRVVSQSQSPYGHLVVTESEGQRAFFHQGLPLFTTQDTAAREERIHFALAQREKISVVLLIGGAASRAADEALKYEPQRVDCVDPDPAVLEALKQAGGAAVRDPRIAFIETDARRYIRRTTRHYDAIVLGLPAPESVQLNRFFTREFFAEAAARLNPGGVVAFDLPGSEGYLSPVQQALLASIHGALQSAFRHTLVIPGEKIILVGSDAPLDSDVPAILARRHISARYMTAGYMSSRLTPERLKAVRMAASAPAQPNGDFLPASHGHALGLWLEMSGGTLVWPLVSFAALIVVIGSLLSRGPLPGVTAAIATTGFAGISLEVILIIAFQVLYGSIYLHLGMLFAAFMIGTVAGAFLALRGWIPGGTRGLVLLDAVFVVLAPSAAATVQALAAVGAPAFAGFALIAAGLGTAGFVVGAQFPLASRAQADVRESSTFFYAADLAGACLGAFATAALLLPVIGLAGICWLLAGIKLASLAGLCLAPVGAATGVSLSRRAGPGGWVAVGYFVLSGVLIVSAQTQMSIYSATFSKAYVFAVVMAIFAALWAAWHEGADAARQERRSPSRLVAGWLNLSRSKWFTVVRTANYLVLGLVAFFPVFRCYFRVPYLFCHVCPRQCIFGYLRPYLVGGALLANLGQAPFCQWVCPVGTLCDARTGTPPGPRLRRVLWGVRLSVLMLIAVFYFLMERSSGIGSFGTGRLYAVLFKNDYAVSLWGIGIAAAFIVLGWKLKRFFCLALCPIGATSDLAAVAIRKIPERPGAVPGGKGAVEVSRDGGGGEGHV